MLKEIMLGIYATSMFAPVAFVGANIAYYGFNKNAQAQTVTREERGEPIYYQTNEILGLYSNVYANHAYTYYYRTTDQPDLNNQQFIYLKMLDEYTPLIGAMSGDEDTRNQIVLTSYYNKQWCILNKWTGRYWNITKDIPIVPIDFSTSWGSSGEYEKLVSHLGTKSNYFKGYDTVNITTNNDIVGSLGNAMERTFEIPVFSWSTSSVLSEPVGDLCNVVGINDSPLVPLFTYWVTITALFLALDVLIKLPTFFFNR